MTAAPRALSIARALAILVLLSWPLGAGILLLTRNAWSVNRLNVQVWITVTKPLGLQSVIGPELFASIANVVLFVPFFAALAVLLPRWWWIAGGIAISGTVELYQLGTGSRDATFEDLATNTLGTVIGVASGIRLHRRLRRWGQDERPELSSAAAERAAAAGDRRAPGDPTTPSGAPDGTAHGPSGASDDRG